MRHIYLLRHCDYDNPRGILPGRLPVELSEAGWDQARRLQKYFSDKNIKKIYSSAVLRCKQTAQEIAGGKIEVVLDQRLLEALSAYQGYWGDNRHSDGFHFFTHQSELGGEGFQQIRSRIAEFWDEIILRDEGDIIICSHGDPLQLLYGHIHDLPVPDELTPGAEIEGWLEKGEFIKLTFNDATLQNAGSPQII